MSFAAVVLGRREPKRARSDLVCGITAARLTFEIELGLTVRAAAIAFDPFDATGLATVTNGLEELLASVAEDTGAILAREDDGFGFRWITLSGGDLDDLAISVSVVAESLDLAGYWEQVVCGVFAFEPNGRNTDSRVYWIYNFARGGFYAFIPAGLGRRDSEEELRLQAAIANDLRLEPDAQRRHPVWNIPL